MVFAHLSDIHICNNRANIVRLFWDFLLVSGVPSALRPFVGPMLKSTRHERQLLGWLLRRPGAALNPVALAVSIGVTLPVAVFLARRLIHFRRIFYIRKDRPELRRSLLADVRQAGVDHVLISGDFVNLADPTEYEIAATMVSGLGGRPRVTIVPGNHDVDIQRMKRPRAISPEEKLDRFMEHLRVPESFPEAIRVAKRLPFPVVRLLGRDLCLIGLDSTTYHPIHNTRGTIEARQLDVLSDLLAEPAIRDRFKVVLLHHHLTDVPRKKRFEVRALDRVVGRMDSYLLRPLTNAAALHEMIRSARVDLVVHGHRHVPYASWIGETRVQCAGSATHADATGTFSPSYNLLRIEKGGIEASRRVYGEDGWSDAPIPESLLVEGGNAEPDEPPEGIEDVVVDA